MRKETVLKGILLVIIGIMLLARPINVFAEPADLNDPNLWEDQGSKEDIGGDTPTNPTPTPDTQTPEPTPSTPSTTTPNTETQKEELPKAGLAEDTMMVVATFGLIATAIFAYKKTSEYNGI